MVTDIGSHTVSAPRVASISGDSSARGTSEVKTIHTTCTPLFRRMGDSDIFLTTTDTLPLLILSLMYVCNTCNPGGKGHTPRLKLTCFQRCHHHMGALPKERLNSTLQDLGLKWPQPHILLHEDKLIYLYA